MKSVFEYKSWREVWPHVEAACGADGEVTRATLAERAGITAAEATGILVALCRRGCLDRTDVGRYVVRKPYEPARAHTPRVDPEPAGRCRGVRRDGGRCFNLASHGARCAVHRSAEVAR